MSSFARKMGRKVSKAGEKGVKKAERTVEKTQAGLICAYAHVTIARMDKYVGCAPNIIRMTSMNAIFVIAFNVIKRVKLIELIELIELITELNGGVVNEEENNLCDV